MLTPKQSEAAPIIDPLSRRNFMKWSGGCAALSSSAILSQLLNLHLTQSAVAQTGGGSDYKALVCVFLLGGVDSFNVVTPYEQDEYDKYVDVRENLALPRETFTDASGVTHEGVLPIPIDIANPSGRKVGLHPGMSGMRDLYNDGNAAVDANVGSLVYPVTKTQYQQKNVKLPLGLFSHSDLIKHWQTSIPDTRSATTGWGGRMADLLNATVDGDPSPISMNISLGGLNRFQTGSDIIPYAVGTNGATRLNGYAGTGGGGQDAIYRAMLDQYYTSSDDSELSNTYRDLLQHTLAKTKRISIDAAADFATATSAEPEVVFPSGNRLADQLKMVAKVIRGRSSLNRNRQIFFVTAGGWDHHDEVIDAQAGMLPQVSQALKAFYDETEAMGVSDQVTTFTASDFGRTLSSNGNGSDHAWGGNHFVIGGSVDGGKVHGGTITENPPEAYPADLALGNDLDVGRGRLIPTTTVDEYNAELAMWFGMADDGSLEDVLPNIRHFHSAGSGNPVGFMG